MLTDISKKEEKRPEWRPNGFQTGILGIKDHDINEKCDQYCRHPTELYPGKGCCLIGGMRLFCEKPAVMKSYY